MAEGLSEMASRIHRIELLLVPHAGETVDFAARELRDYLIRVTGRPVTLVRQAGLPSASLLIRDCGTGRISLPSAVTPPAEADSYVLHCDRPGSALLAGGSARGLLFGVYGLLEEFLGCRWYGPYEGDEVVPYGGPDPLERLITTTRTMRRSPGFAFCMREFRDLWPAAEEVDARIVDQIAWWAKLRMNCFLFNFHFAHNGPLWERWQSTVLPEVTRRGILLGIGEHGSYPLFLNPGRYAEAHPEWYCEIDGHRIGGFSVPSGGSAQFCTTNEAAVETYVANFVEFARAHPAISVYYPAPNDAGGWCQCARCSTIDISDRYLALTNRVAEALTAYRPDVRVIHLAYANHREPPREVTPHHAVDVDVACWGRDFSYPLTDPRTMPGQANHLDAFYRWIEICRGAATAEGRSRVFYHCKLMRHMWLGPHLRPLDAIDTDIPAAHRMGIEGFDFPMGFPGIRTKALNAYAIARKCWDVRADTAGFVDEHFALAFAGAATAARHAYEAVDSSFTDLRYGRSVALVPADGLPADTWLLRPDAASLETVTQVREAAEAARRQLASALESLRPLTDAGAEETNHRIRRLVTILEQLQMEQALMAGLAQLATLLLSNGTNEGQEYSSSIDALLEQLTVQVDEAASRYRIEDDLAGLLWAGASHHGFANALAAWRTRAEEHAANLRIVVLPGWSVSDFPTTNVQVAKWIDITEHVVGPGSIRVLWRWTGGQLGVTIAETSLWVEREGDRVCLSWDTHSGFAGAMPRSPSYRLLLTQYEPGARYFIMGRLQAYSTRGTLVERGTEGVIELGVPVP